MLNISNDFFILYFQLSEKKEATSVEICKNRTFATR